MKNLNIVFFDGDCLLCNRVVKWLVKNENGKGPLLHFAPLHGETASHFLEPNLLVKPYSSLVFKSSDLTVLTGSRAVRALRPFLNHGASLQLLFVREFLYRVIAKSRTLWGRTNYQSCDYSYIDPKRILP